MLSYAVHTQIWWIAFIGIMLIYSGVAQYCPIFHALGVNKLKAEHNYHQSLLPGHNPEPVYLFEKHGDLVFRNEAARNILPNLKSMEALQQESDQTDFRTQGEQEIAGFTA